MNPRSETHGYAPESPTALVDLLRAELVSEPLPGTAGYRPRPHLHDTGDIRLTSGRPTAEAVAWILGAAYPDTGALRFTVAIRDVDGLTAAWYEFRAGTFKAIDVGGEPTASHPVTVFVSGSEDAVRGGGVHEWRRSLLAAGAAGEVAQSHARAVGYVFESVAASSTPDASGRDFLIQAWGLDTDQAEDGR